MSGRRIAFLAVVALYGVGQAGDPLAAQTAPTLRSGSISQSDYPKDARRRKVQGQVEMLLTIDEKGRVADCAVNRSSGDADLDTASCSFWSKRFRYSPGRDSEGKKTSMQIVQEIAWRIDAPCPPMSASGICVKLD